MAAARPYFGYSIDRLRSLFERSGTDDRVLSALEAELTHRSTTSAAALKREVRAKRRKARKEGGSVTCEGCGVLLEFSLADGDAEFSCPDCGIDFAVETNSNGTQRTHFRHGGETICIDFGTSSIRAAVRYRHGPPDVLPLGAIVQSSIDDESIPSAIAVLRSLDRIAYGEEALARGMGGERLALYEASPKRWMTEGDVDSFSGIRIASLDLTQMQLTTGLLAYAVRAICKASGIPVTRLRSTDVRISHPVWRATQADAKATALSQVLRAAIECAAVEECEARPQSLGRLTYGDSGLKRPNTIDVVEPVAAALELFSNEDNSRQACVVIDIGAGTMDLAAFLSVTPDLDYAGRRKLSRIASPRSLPRAGDAIDAELVSLLQDRIGPEASIEVRGDIDRRKRQIKEQLFEKGRVREHGVEFPLQRLISSPNMKALAGELRSEFLGLMSEAVSQLRPFALTTFHPVTEIVVVFAGGGAGIEFLRDCIPDRVRIDSKVILPVIRRAKALAPSARDHASFERLAVARGGTTPKQYWPQTSVIAHE